MKEKVAALEKRIAEYGRYVVALTHRESGNKEVAKRLLQEIRTKYKDAIDHRGKPIAEVAEAAEKELAIK